MIVRTCIFAVFFLFSSVFADDHKDQVLRDMAIGMEGLQNVANDPAQLAMLMQDLQVRFLRWMFRMTYADVDGI